MMECAPLAHLPDVKERVGVLLDHHVMADLPDVGERNCARHRQPVVEDAQIAV